MVKRRCVRRMGEGESLEGNSNSKGKGRIQLLDLPNEVLTLILDVLCEEVLDSSQRILSNSILCTDPSQIGLRNLLLTCQRFYSFLHSSNLKTLKCTHYFGYLQELCNREMWKQVEKEIKELHKRNNQKCAEVELDVVHAHDAEKDNYDERLLDIMYDQYRYTKEEWEPHALMVFALKQKHPALFYECLRCHPEVRDEAFEFPYGTIMAKKIDPARNPAFPMPSPWKSSTRSTPLFTLGSVKSGDESFFLAICKAAYPFTSPDDCCDFLFRELSRVIQSTLITRYIPPRSTEFKTRAPFIASRIITKEWVDILRFALYQLPARWGMISEPPPVLFSSKTLVEIVLSGETEVIFALDEYFRNVADSPKDFMYPSDEGPYYASVCESLPLDVLPYRMTRIVNNAQDTGRAKAFTYPDAFKEVYVSEHCRIMRVLMACTAFASGQEEISKKILSDESLGVKSIGKEEAYVDECGRLLVRFVLCNLETATIKDNKKRLVPAIMVLLVSPMHPPSHKLSLAVR
eukprot:Nk52_evm20s1485 gene=Nk52_evmTU20s1485